MNKAIIILKKVIVICGQVLGVLVILFFASAFLGLWGGKPREKARQTVCASNMKQIGLALAQYEQDNDGNYPNIADAKDANTTWRTMVYPYAKSMGMFKCPDRDDKPNAADGFPISYAANYTGDYSGSKEDKGNGAFAGRGSKPVSIGDTENPGALIMLCEVAHHSTLDFNIDNQGAFNPSSDTLWAGHTNGSNYLLVDGHLKWLKPLDTKDFWHRDSSLPLSAGSVTILQKAGERNGK